MTMKEEYNDFVEPSVCKTDDSDLLVNSFTFMRFAMFRDTET